MFVEVRAAHVAPEEPPAPTASQYIVDPFVFSAYPAVPRELLARSLPITVLPDTVRADVTVALFVDVLPDTVRFVLIVARPV